MEHDKAFVWLPNDKLPSENIYILSHHNAEWSNTKNGYVILLLFVNI